MWKLHHKKGTFMDSKRKQIYNSLMFMGLVGGISNYDSDLDIDFDILDEDSKKDNLDGRYTTAKDIMRVYEPIFFLSDFSKAPTREILWERDESKEVTMSEVEAKFGCKVKIVKG